MNFMAHELLPCLLAVCVLPALAQKYEGPKPPKPDVPYLLHAGNLVETEATEAKEETRKDSVVYTVAGASSPAKTPLAEPVFILQTDKIQAERLELYRMEVRNGQREVISSTRKRGTPARVLHLSVARLGGGLWKVEANEPLSNGQYSLTPAGSNQVFCFEVY